MNDKEKQRFHGLSEKDKKRYDGEMATFKTTKAGKDSRKKKRVKDPNAPKRSLSAFFWFCNDERPKAKALNKDASVGEIAKELGRRWNACTADQKSKYEQLAAKDKARYEKVRVHLPFKFENLAPCMLSSVFPLSGQVVQCSPLESLINQKRKINLWDHF